MNEMQCDENKIVYVQGKTQAPPQTMSQGCQTPSPPPAKEQNESR
jgi:hypothetical protein